MNHSIDALYHSAELVKSWSGAILPNGKSLAEALTVQGISWWDVAAPNLAVYYLPPYLSAENQVLDFKRRVSPYLAWVRQIALSIRRSQRYSVGCDRWPDKPACLFLGFSPYIYRDVLQSVSEQIAGSQMFSTVSLCDNPRHALKHEQSQWDCVWQHWNAAVALGTRTLRELFQKALAELRAMHAMPEVIRDADQSLWLKTRSLFNWLFLVYFPALLPQAAVAEHILQQHRPALIVSGDVDDARNRLYCLIARKLGIPSLEIQFGMYGSEGVEWQFFVADHLAVWGEQAHDVMLSQHVSPARLTVTGSPRHDQIVRRAGASQSETRARLGVPADKVMVLFACPYSGFVDQEKFRAVKDAIFRTVATRHDVVLVVKHHPGEKPDQTERLARGHPNIIKADAHGDIRELILACDAFITLGSTSTMDALLAGKPVIWPDLAGLVWWDDNFISSGATLVVRSEQELARSFDRLTDGSIAEVMATLKEDRQRFLERWAFRADGRASERIADLALAIIRQGRNRAAGDFTDSSHAGCRDSLVAEDR